MGKCIIMTGGGNGSTSESEVLFEDYTGSTPVPDAETALTNIKTGSKLSVLISNIKAVLKGTFLKKYILTTMEEVMANTVAGRTADALLLKEVNSDLNEGNLSFDYDANALYYEVKVGADTVRKKCSGELKKVTLFGVYTGNVGGSWSRTYNVKTSYPDIYSALTINNFAYSVPGIWIEDNCSVSWSHSYNQSTGIYTVTGTGDQGPAHGWNCTVNAYMFYSG